MISLENLDYSQVRNAITTNLYELLDNDPNKFVDYFKELYSEHNYIVYIISKMINDEFVKSEDVPNAVLKEDDVVEFLYFMGGGSNGND